jgi:glutaminase
MNALSSQLGISSPIQHYLEELHRQYAQVHDGEVATYIPELARADKNWFGICIATTDGHVYEVGDSRQQFTIQSISKPLVYGLVLEDHGEEKVLNSVGVEPTGDAFNSISLDPQSGCPFNPMINAGAIAIAGLVKGESAADKLKRVLHTFSTYAGHELTLDAMVYQSEKNTGHRNRAIGHMLRNFNIVSDDPEPVLDLYFQQCSIAVNCRDLAVMAASLANGGINPITGLQAIKRDYVENVLSVMATCGMYDYAGEWIYKVGMPAKSGVGGGILAVLPGQLGIGIFSPALDIHGNSVRGLLVCRTLSQDFNLHLFDVPGYAKSVIRLKYDATRVHSRRVRNEKEAAALREYGSSIKIYELQGDLTFTSTEVVVRNIVQSLDSMHFAILDMKRVMSINSAASKLLCDLVRSMIAQHVYLVFSHTDIHEAFSRELHEMTGLAVLSSPLIFDDNDFALEWCEDQLLTQKMVLHCPAEAIPLAEHPLCRGLTTQQLSHLHRYLCRVTFHAGDMVLKRGEPPDNMYLLMKGEVSTSVQLPSGKLKRLSLFSAGAIFGEMAFIDQLPRSADVRADTDVECYALSREHFDCLSQADPDLRASLLENLVRHISQMLRRTNEEIGVLAQ